MIKIARSDVIYITTVLVLVGIAALGLTAVDFLAISMVWSSDADKTGTLLTSSVFSGMVVVFCSEILAHPAIFCLCGNL